MEHLGIVLGLHQILFLGLRWAFLILRRKYVHCCALLTRRLGQVFCGVHPQKACAADHLLPKVVCNMSYQELTCARLGRVLLKLTIVSFVLLKWCWFAQLLNAHPGVFYGLGPSVC